MDPELLFKVLPGLNRENASVCFLIKHIFGPLGSTTTFEECEGPRDPLLFVVELLRGQADVERAGVQESMAVVTLSAEVWGVEELGIGSSCQRSRGRRHWRGWYR